MVGAALSVPQPKRALGDLSSPRGGARVDPNAPAIFGAGIFCCATKDAEGVGHIPSEQCVLSAEDLAAMRLGRPGGHEGADVMAEAMAGSLPLSLDETAVDRMGHTASAPSAQSAFARHWSSHSPAVSNKASSLRSAFGKHISSRLSSPRAYLSHNCSTQSVSRPKIGDLTISERVLRGVPASGALTCCGKLFRSSPCDMRPEELSKLYDMSAPCEELDAFISHAWSCPWWQRYLALLIHIYWKPAAVAACSTAALLFFCDLGGLLPMYEVAEATSAWEWQLLFQGSLHYSPWPGYPPIVGLVVLFLCPLLDCGGLGYGRVFFDLVCINQTNERLKAEGLAHLGGFLARSRELIVLWAPTNLTRAWCIFELAVFSALEGARKVTWCPLFLYVYFFFTYLFVTLGVWAYEMYRVLPWREGQEGLWWVVLAPFLSTAANCVLASLVLHYGRQSMSERFEFCEAIASFDIRAAQCRMPSDKEYICRSVQHWYGNEAGFNDYVQVAMAHQILTDLAWLDQTYTTGAIASFAFSCLGLEWIAAHLRSTLSWGQTAKGVANILVFVYCVVPLSLRLGWALFGWLRRRSQSPLLNSLVTAVAGSGWYLAFYLLTLAYMSSSRVSLAAWALLCAALLGATLLAFAPRCRCG